MNVVQDNYWKDTIELLTVEIMPTLFTNKLSQTMQQSYLNLNDDRKRMLFQRFPPIFYIIFYFTTLPEYSNNPINGMYIFPAWSAMTITCLLNDLKYNFPFLLRCLRPMHVEWIEYYKSHLAEEHEYLVVTVKESSGTWQRGFSRWRQAHMDWTSYAVCQGYRFGKNLAVGGDKTLEKVKLQQWEEAKVVMGQEFDASLRLYSLGHRQDSPCRRVAHFTPNLSTIAGANICFADIWSTHGEMKPI
ncbi:hypothetical protein ARMGADRAFT_1032189 [Armillaria gallica]|uniref:Uncharacterized protein n=1 Tax=Armillaria gallica TaxID=47427 RepID=A0A2H3DT77_ARMGA|nr:hypothetical protein ARMGADRAFT_1032189 [Armillaria gallica]